MSVCSFFRRNLFGSAPKAPFYKWREPEHDIYILNPCNSVTPSDYLRIYSEYLTLIGNARINGRRPDPGALADILHHLHGYALCARDFDTAHKAIRVLADHGRFSRIVDIAERGQEQVRFIAMMVLLVRGEWNIAADVALHHDPESYVHSLVLFTLENNFDSLVSGKHVRAIKFLLERTTNPRILKEGGALLDKIAADKARGVQAVPPVPPVPNH